MKKRAKKFVIGKPPLPARTTVLIRGRVTGGEEKYIVKFAIYADPSKVAAVIEKVLTTQFR